MANKYIPIKVSGVILNISKVDKEVESYSESLLSVHIPDGLDNEPLKKQKAWIDQNNYRMNKICQFMNENNL